MLPLLAAAAIRGLLLVATLRLAQSLLHLRNVHTRMALWRCALAACCAMPVLLLWHPIALTPPQVTLPATTLASAVTTIPSVTVSLQNEPDAAPVILNGAAIASAIYVAVTTLLLARLGAGLARSWAWFRAARPAGPAFGASPNVRLSTKLSVPVTFANTILLPEAARDWPEEKRRAVMRHEMAHVAHADFTILLISALHRAVFWFNPAAWWLHHELCNLAEARSDEAAMQTADRFDYAEILLGIAAVTHAVPAGVPMARPATINRRISQILRATTTEAPMTWKKYVLAASCVAVPALLAAATLAGQAQADSAVTLDAATLDRYAGMYRLGPADIMTIVHQGNGLTAQLTGQQALPIFPQSANQFVYTAVKASITFNTGADGAVTGLVLHQNGANVPAPRITQAEANADLSALKTRIDRNQPEPGSEAALRTTIAAQASGNPDYNDMTAKLAQAVQRQAPRIGPILAQLGTLQSVHFQGVTPKGWDLYDVRFANGDTQWRITLDETGKIAGLLFQAAP
jgi:beta-lactamase regulating signal transducer with metallopeptidase domain